MLRRLLKDTKGATATDYALLAGLIGIGLVSSAGAVGSQLGGTFDEAEMALGDKDKKEKKDKKDKK